MPEEKINSNILEQVHDPLAEYVLRGDLEMVLQTPQGMRTVYVLVEGKFDKDVYSQRVFDKRTTKVKIAAKLNNKGEAKGGKQNVLNIVDYFTKRSKLNVIGIIDNDYDYYCNPTITRPQNIFETDYRDLEMTLLQNAVVTSTLLSDAFYASKYDECIDKCRKLGFIRVAAAMKGFESHIGNWKSASIWDSGSEKPGWLQYALNVAIDVANEKGIAFVPNMVDKYRVQFGLDTEPIYRVCRGHDVVRLWSHMIQHQATHSPNHLCGILRDACPIKDIRSWKLYKDIQVWENASGYKVLI